MKNKEDKNTSARDNGKQEEKKCFSCEHYREGYFCGYISCNCTIYGSLDCDQKERHPDITAASCKDYCKTDTPHSVRKQLYEKNNRY